MEQPAPDTLRAAWRRSKIGTHEDRHRPAPASRDPLGRPHLGRIAGIDLARALAIIGMLAVHVGPTHLGGLTGQLYALTHGRASILFVFVAGVGVSLLAASRSGTPGEARLKLAWRALLLLPAGLALQELDHGILVILQEYSALFVVAAVAISLPDRWLVRLAAIAGTLGPLVFLTGRLVAPATFNRAGVAITDPLGEIAHGLVFSGPYPLITWAAPFLLGMWLGRRDLGAPSVRTALVLGGAAVAWLASTLSGSLEAMFAQPFGPVGWGRLVSDAPHSQMPLWLAGSTGSAALVLGLALIAADTLGRLVWPLVATGQLALTVYVGHLLALHWWREALTSNDIGEATMIVLAITAVAAMVSVAWRAVLPRGPLEALLRAPWRRSAPVQRADTAGE